MGLRRTLRRGEGRRFHQDLCSPLKMGENATDRGPSRQSTAELDLRLWGWIWRNRRRGEDVQSAHRLLWQAEQAGAQGTASNIYMHQLPQNTTFHVLKICIQRRERIKNIIID